MSDRNSTGANCTRRRLLGASTAAIGGLALAGCLGDGENDTSQAGAGLGNGNGNGNGGDTPSDPLLTDDFDPNDPDWENNNYYASEMVEHDYLWGRLEDLEAILDREVDEPPHGDPVAETPDDPDEWIDPDTLIYVDNPGEDRLADYDETMQPMMDRIEETTGKETEIVKVDSYAATVETLRSRRAHMGQVPTGSVPFAVNLADYVPRATPLRTGEQFGYRLFAITRSDTDDIRSVEDFPGRRIAHAQPGSNSGNQAPSALFDQVFDVTAGEDYEVEFSGGHDQTSRGIGFGDFEAGPVCSSCWRNAIDNTDDLEYDDFKVLWASDPFPSSPMGYVADLHPDIQEGLEEAWIETDWEGTALHEEYDYLSLEPVEYKKHWYQPLIIQRYNGVDYDSGELSS